MASSSVVRQIGSLFEGGRSMLLQKLKRTVLTLLVVGAIASSAVYSGQETIRQTGKPDLRQIAAKPGDGSPQPGPGRMFVTGRVLDPNGQPVPGAAIAAYARILTLGGAPYMARRTHTPIGDARADGSGRFRIDVPRTASSRQDAFGAIALAPGYGAGWVVLDPDDN